MGGPDVRIYWIAGKCIGFRIRADAFDYRVAQRREIEPLDDLPQAATAGLQRLLERMGLDWRAADFKARPEDGELTFLEINSDPMFSVFDHVGNGTITSSIVGFLAATNVCLS